MSNIFWSNIFKKQTSELHTIASLWQSTPLFKNIPTRHIEFLSAKMHVRHFQPDEVIFQQGDQAAGAILDYLSETQRSSLDHIDRLLPYRSGESLEIDEATRRSLELTRTIRDGSRDGSPWRKM